MTHTLSIWVLHTWLAAYGSSTGLDGETVVVNLTARQDRVRLLRQPCRFVVLPYGKGADVTAVRLTPAEAAKLLDRGQTPLSKEAPAKKARTRKAVAVKDTLPVRCVACDEQFVTQAAEDRHFKANPEHRRYAMYTALAKARHGAAWLGVAWSGTARRGEAWQGAVGGEARHGAARAVARHGSQRR